MIGLNSFIRCCEFMFAILFYSFDRTSVNLGE